MSQKTLYELVEKEGTHLADSHKTEGAKSGALLDNETNRPCGAGEFIPRVVDIDDEEDNDLIDDDHSDESSDSNALGILVSFAVGFGLAKAYPYVKKWVVDTAMPGVKRLWREITKKDTVHKAATEGNGLKSISALQEPEEFSQIIDQAVNQYHVDMSSEEAQQHLLHIMYYALCMAHEIRQLTNATLNDEERLKWGAALETLTT